MSGERRWGHSVWVWWALALSAAASVALFLLSLTESGRIFSVMLLVFEAGVALTLYLGWARSERARFDAELRGDAGDGDLA